MKTITLNIETQSFFQNTLKRVVPLQHSLFIDQDSVYRVKDKDKINKSKIDQAFNFLQKYRRNDYNNNRELRKKEKEYIDNIKYFEQFQKKEKEKWRKKDYNKNKGQRTNPKITKIHYKIEEIVDYLYDEDLCPAVIFVFSIKKITE